MLALSGGAVWIARGLHDDLLARVAALIPASLNQSSNTFDREHGDRSRAARPSATSAPTQHVARPAIAALSRAPAENPAPGSPPTPPPPPAATLPPFSPADEFERIVSLADRSIAVTVKPASQKVVIDHDLLHFTVTSSVSGYLYVFIVDPAKQYLLLFPNELDRDNRVRAGQPLSLPRASWKMFAGEPAGFNHFVAIVSPVPRDFHALDLQRQSVFEMLSDTAQQSAAARRTPLASPFAGEPVCPRDDASGGVGATPRQPPCPAGYGAASFKIEAVASSR